jgi:hypothetical protein
MILLLGGIVGTGCGMRSDRYTWPVHCSHRYIAWQVSPHQICVWIYFICDVCVRFRQKSLLSPAKWFYCLFELLDSCLGVEQGHIHAWRVLKRLRSNRLLRGCWNASEVINCVEGVETPLKASKEWLQTPANYSSYCLLPPASPPCYGAPGRPFRALTA